MMFVNNMAAVKRIDLAVQFVDNVNHKPPPASKPSYTIQKFHNRSTLFPSTYNKHLYLDKEEGSTDNTQERRPASSNVNIPKPPLTDRKRVRNIQSAKARLERTNSKTYNEILRTSQKYKDDSPLTCYSKNNATNQRVPHYDFDVNFIGDDKESGHSYSSRTESDKNSNLALVPIGGKAVPVVDVGWEAPYPEYHYQSNAKEKHRSTEIRPFVTPSVDVALLSRPFDNAQTNEPVINDESHLKPSVYGLSLQRQVYGSEQELSKIEDTGPYKLSSDSDLKDEHPIYSKETQCGKTSRLLPWCLQPLSPWLTDNIPQSFIGVDPKKCLVFLPSLLDVDYDDLPEVPLPHSVDEDLPFKEKILPTELPPPKKYDHPAFNKKPVEEWVCKHSKTSTRIMSGDGLILHERFSGPRTVGIVRKEIKDLERLIQGIGTLDSDCMMVRYQAEIDNFRKLYDETMAKVPERLRYPEAPPEDMFGLRQFYKEHDEVIREIKREHAICLEELAILEAEVGIESDRKYFKEYAKLTSC